MNALRFAFVFVILLSNISLINAVPWLATYYSVPGKFCNETGGNLNMVAWPMEFCLKEPGTSRSVYRVFDSTSNYVRTNTYTASTTCTGAYTSTYTELEFCTPTFAGGVWTSSYSTVLETRHQSGKAYTVTWTETASCGGTQWSIKMESHSNCPEQPVCASGKVTLCGSYWYDDELETTVYSPYEISGSLRTNPQSGKYPPLANTGKVGTNLEDLHESSSLNWALNNAFKASRDWIHGDQALYIWDVNWNNTDPNDQKPYPPHLQKKLPVDKNGYVTSLPWANGCARTMVLGGGNNPSGKWIFTYAGSGTFNFMLPTGVTKTSEVAGRVEFNVPASMPDSIVINIMSIVEGNHPRNMSFRHYLQEFNQLMWHPDFVNAIRGHNVLRFMDLGKTNLNEIVDWKQRPRLADARWSSNRGIPYEAMLELANQAGANPWLNIPIKVNNEWIPLMYELVRTWLRDGYGQTLYLEFGNEPWNWAYPGMISSYAAAQAALNPALYGTQGATSMRWYADRASLMLDFFKLRMGSRCLRVFGAQSSYTDLAYQALYDFKPSEKMYKKFDALAIAPYIGGSITYTNTLTSTQVLDQMEADINNAKAQITANLNMIRPWNLTLISYEGGQHLNCDLGGNKAAATPLFRGVQTHSRMLTIYNNYFAAWKSLSPTLFTHFQFSGRWGSWGFWGARSDLSQPVSTANPKALSWYNYVQANKV